MLIGGMNMQKSMYETWFYVIFSLVGLRTFQHPFEYTPFVIKKSTYLSNISASKMMWHKDNF